MSETRSGGCLCGAVRYEANWPPFATVVCHCLNCQKQAGSALSVVAALPRDGLTISGELTQYQDKGSSGQPVYRRFCGKCGSPVITDTPAAEAEGIIFIKAGTLDEAADLKPTLHYWSKRAQGWFTFPDGVERLEEQ
jgi:hypothetical protein